MGGILRCAGGWRASSARNHRTHPSEISSTTKSLPPNFDQADTDAIFAGFGFRSHAELAEEDACRGSTAIMGMRDESMGRGLPNATWRCPRLSVYLDGSVHWFENLK